jgi:hypothetical protein
MRTLTTPGFPAQDRPAERRPARGRWFWGVSGVVTLTALAIPLWWTIARAGVPEVERQQAAQSAPETFTVRQPVTSLNVDSYGANIVVTAGPVHDVQVTDVMTFDPKGSGTPVITQSVSRGLLTLDAPACDQSPCSVGFKVTVPSDVAVTASSGGGMIRVSGVAAANLDTGGGPARVSDISRTLTVSTEGGSLTASGVADANLDSGGAPLRVTGARGPLTVSTEGGALTLHDLAGPLDADTGGGNLLARGVSAVTATVSTESGDMNMAFTAAPQMVSLDSGGGNARIVFGAAPQSVTVSTEGGLALLTLPSGPYAVNVDTDGGPPPVVLPGIVDDPTAHRSVSVTSGGGPLQIQPAG